MKNIRIYRTITKEKEGCDSQARNWLTEGPTKQGVVWCDVMAFLFTLFVRLLFIMNQCIADIDIDTDWHTPLSITHAYITPNLQAVHGTVGWHKNKLSYVTVGSIYCITYHI